MFYVVLGCTLYALLLLRVLLMILNLEIGGSRLIG